MCKLSDVCRLYILRKQSGNVREVSARPIVPKTVSVTGRSVVRRKFDYFELFGVRTSSRVLFGVGGIPRCQSIPMICAYVAFRSDFWSQTKLNEEAQWFIAVLHHHLIQWHKNSKRDEIYLLSVQTRTNLKCYPSSARGNCPTGLLMTA